MRYAILHAPRSGSNMLCSLINKTGVLGLSSYEDCGFFIGHGESISSKPLAKINAFFKMQRTANGIEGCKFSFEYIDEIAKHCGRKFALDFLNSFSFFVINYRQDLIAQAVSFYFARQTGIFSTKAIDNNQKPKRTPVYNYDEIAYAMGEIQAQYKRFELWELTRRSKRFIYTHYEKTVENPLLPLAQIAIACGITGDCTLDNSTPYEVLQFVGIDTNRLVPEIRVQKSPLKTEFVNRFKRELKNAN